MNFACLIVFHASETAGGILSNIDEFEVIVKNKTIFCRYSKEKGSFLAYYCMLIMDFVQYLLIFLLFLINILPLNPSCLIIYHHKNTIFIGCFFVCCCPFV